MRSLVSGASFACLGTFLRASAVSPAPFNGPPFPWTTVNYLGHDAV